MQLHAKPLAPHELLIVNGSDPSPLTSEYVDLQQRAGVDCWVYTQLSEYTSGHWLSAIYELLDAESHRLVLARTVADIRSARARGAMALVLGWQDASALEDRSHNDWTVRPPRTSLRMYYELGLRIVNLAYNLSNAFGGGCLDDHVGLTKAGRHLIAAMQDMGVLVDCGGHTGEQTSLDIIAIAERPVVCSHSNVAALNDNPRATSDRVIEGIARTGGVFGVSAVDEFMTRSAADVSRDVPRATVARYVQEYEYLRSLVGVDHIGMGTDFTFGLDVEVDPETSFVFPPEMSSRQRPIRYARGFERIDELPNVLGELRERGWAEADIAKVMGGNWLRVFEQAWGG